ncbi:F420-dependent oxidoreductase [Amycolatopsis thailandensis]|uniref:F420-dependent oxidoreductase n=1 Tax=Amycolatopsis thailandensis TaxID=589330 RepID=A0A229RW00_9PSEU|nr:Pr6Pr family membrane protein [Amycolatopsis thailandensis]OXM50842.1 F420-dependent oxidoreductase [Amycolatopsis thailandensis]
MQASKIARAWFGATALVVIAGLAAQIPVSAGTEGGTFHTPAGRVANLLAFFTIDSNILVGIGGLLLALGVAGRSTVFGVLRLTGLVGIIVTGVVFQVALADLYELHGWALFADTMLHKVSPLMCVAGWLLFGPRGQLSWRVLWWSLLYPLAWLAVTLVRGAIIGFYPYPFVDPGVNGYGGVAFNCVLIGLLFIGLAAAAVGFDRTFGRRDDTDDYLAPDPAESVERIRDTGAY